MPEIHDFVILSLCDANCDSFKKERWSSGYVFDSLPDSDSHHDDFCRKVGLHTRPSGSPYRYAGGNAPAVSDRRGNRYALSNLLVYLSLPFCKRISQVYLLGYAVCSVHKDRSHDFIGSSWACLLYGNNFVFEWLPLLRIPLALVHGEKEHLCPHVKDNEPCFHGMHVFHAHPKLACGFNRAPRRQME